VSWDAAWETVYTQQVWGKYPQEELIRFVARSFYAAPDRSEVRILDAGCGPGSGVWYLAREGFDAWGIDGSPTAIAQAGARLAEEGLSAELRVGDFTRLGELFEPETFDAVVDVTSLQHNPAERIVAAHAGIQAVLKPDGRVFSMLVNRQSWGDGLGEEVDSGTFVDIREGPLQGKGLTHFSSREDVERFFEGYASVEVNTSSRTLDGGRQQYGHWVVEALRPA
jgi:SAM-dependent methyltransferase